MQPTTLARSRPDFRLPRSHEAFVRANRVSPGSVNSPARAFGIPVIYEFPSRKYIKVSAGFM